MAHAYLLIVTVIKKTNAPLNLMFALPLVIHFFSFKDLFVHPVLLQEHIKEYRKHYRLAYACSCVIFL